MSSESVPRQSKADYYAAHQLDSIEDVWPFFPGDEANEMNWLFLSTSGVHGSYATLDEEPDEDGERWVTALVVQPRMVRTFYGHLLISDDDLPRLRKIVSTTLAGVMKSQEGNT